MAKIRGEYPDYTKPSNKAFFFLECDQQMNPYTWNPPINWTGRIDGVEVSFTQISVSGFARDDYDFSSFPKELEK
jgi:hypothetical protein